VSLGDIAAIALTGLAVGAMARFAVPGPDPMPIWLTILLGVAGSIVGGGLGFAVAGLVGALAGSVIAATVLLLLYRRFVQKRPITGPEAQLPPRR
jgi:uncharacterized membrane protein YeaQ/YmgE (transglycosylase-associated protein family)